MKGIMVCMFLCLMCILKAVSRPVLENRKPTHRQHPGMQGETIARKKATQNTGIHIQHIFLLCQILSTVSLTVPNKYLIGLGLSSEKRAERAITVAVAIAIAWKQAWKRVTAKGCRLGVGPVCGHVRKLQDPSIFVILL